MHFRCLIIPFRYSVSDGKHATPATITFIASESFLRLENNKIFVPDFGFGGIVPVFRTNISAQTNLDEDIALINYEISPTNYGQKSVFLKLENGIMKDANGFMQKARAAHKVDRLKFANFRTSTRTSSSTTSTRNCARSQLNSALATCPSNRALTSKSAHLRKGSNFGTRMEYPLLRLPSSSSTRMLSEQRMAPT